MNRLFTKPAISRLVKWLVLAKCMLLVITSSALAANLSDMVGRWFTELQEDGVLQGEKYTVRRQIEVNRADGTKTVTFRFYDNCRMVGEQIDNSAWGVANNVYWSRCTSVIAGGVTLPCSTFSEYDIISASAASNELSYKSRLTGIVYLHTRVAETFSLPASACLGMLR